MTTSPSWAGCGAGRYDDQIAGQRSSRLTDALNHATNSWSTFNGTLFDLRFPREAFSDLKVPPLHIDLRYFARRVGLRGGQKAIERLVGAASRTNLEDVDGAEAVLLWHRYLRGIDCRSVDCSNIIGMTSHRYV